MHLVKGHHSRQSPTASVVEHFAYVIGWINLKIQMNSKVGLNCTREHCHYLFYHIKRKSIEGSPFIASTNNSHLRLTSINRCCQQKQRLKCILNVGKKVA